MSDQSGEEMDVVKRKGIRLLGVHAVCFASEECVGWG